MKIKVLMLAVLTLLIVQASQAQEQRRAKEGHRWSEWALKHPEWCDYHQKKVQFFNNHPDAAQAATVQDKLNSLERGKSQATLAKMLNTPGNELYVLNTWLRNEAQQKAQAEANIQNAQRSIVNHRSAIEQNQHQLNSDAALLARDQGTYRDEMDSHADLIRQAHDARWQHDYHGTHRGRFYTQDDQSAYDSGYHQMRNPYWGIRRSGSFSGQ